MIFTHLWPRSDPSSQSCSSGPSLLISDQTAVEWILPPANTSEKHKHRSPVQPLQPGSAEQSQTATFPPAPIQASMENYSQQPCPDFRHCKVSCSPLWLWVSTSAFFLPTVSQGCCCCCHCSSYRSQGKELIHSFVSPSPCKRGCSSWRENWCSS